MDFKEEIAEVIYTLLEKDFEVNKEDILNGVEIPKDKTNGDFSFPCFRLSKSLRKSPVEIANYIKENINIENTTIAKVEVINGFLNFYIDKSKTVEEVVRKFDNQKEEYGKSDIGNGKKVILEFSSPNIAKPFHIGHLKTTIIGNSLYKIYDYLGYSTVRINHLGDYGTQFAKLIEAYKRWGSEYDLTENTIDKLVELYVRINQLCEEDESVLEECRSTFKKLEEHDPYCVELWEKFRKLSLHEFEKIYDLLDVQFDSMNGESFYSDKMDEVVDILEKSGKLEESQGAKIVDLTDVGIKTPCIIKKSDGTSIYATRDLAAVLYRAKTYDFDKCIYVVGGEQTLHFKQVFAVSKYLGIDEKYTNGLEHVAYGLIRLPEGKMSTRKGNFIKVDGLLNEAVSKVNEVMQDRDIENKEEIAKIVGIGAVIFDYLKESRIKDQVFDIKSALNFNGETGPYVQYTTVRTKSVLEKANYEYNVNEVDFSKLTDEYSLDVLKQISKFNETIVLAKEKNEPSIISRYLLELAKKFSSFYNNNKIIGEKETIEKSRLFLTYMTNVTLKNGLGLLGIKVPEKM